MLLLLICVSIASFFLVSLSPVDPLQANVGQTALGSMSQEQIDQVTDFIQSVDRRGYNNPDILNIINEEVEAFYSGQKSAQDVADVIQRRAQLFVDENR